MVDPSEGPLGTEPASDTDGELTRYARVALDALRAAGLRITRPRRSIVELLERSSKPLTAAALHEALRRRRILVDLASVYRTLAVLEQRSQIHRLSVVEGVVRCSAPGAACHHHLVCRACGEAREVSCRVGDAAAALVDTAGFVCESHRLELLGLCDRCVAAK